MAKPWTTKDVMFVREHVKTHRHKWIAKQVGRTTSAVRAYICKNGLGRQTKAWTEKEDRFVKENWSSMTASQIGKVIGRTAAAVISHCRYMGYRKNES